MRALFTLLVTGIAFGQFYPLESVHVRGNVAIPEDRIVSATGLKIGQSVSRASFTAARERLLETGAFENVGFEFKPSAKNSGYDATFQVTETTPLYRYRFEALPASEKDLRAVLQKQEPIFGDAIPPTSDVMNRYSMAIAKFLGSGAQVIGEVNADDPDELVIVFRPLGDRLNVSEVNFTGNASLTQQELWRIVNPVAIGTPYSEPLFRRMLDSSVRVGYEEKGRVRVAFPKIETVRSTENDGLVVTVAVEEGEVYKLGDVTFTGVDQKRAPELQKLGQWTADQPINFPEIAAGLGRIRKSFREAGYLRATTKLTRDVQDTTHVVNLTVAIDPGPQYHMGKLTIDGLDIISEPPIRKIWRLKEGDPYRESYPDQFLAMIESEGYFDNLARTSTAATIHDETRVVDVTLTFLGAKAAAERDRQRGR